MLRRQTAIKNAAMLLNREYGISLTHNNSRIVIENYDYPEGWKPRTAPLMLRFPDSYPRNQPAVYLPADTKYRSWGHRAKHFYPTDLKSEGWRRWCAHELPWDTSIYHVYKPGEVDFLSYIRASLEYPWKSDPIQYAESQYGGL